MLIPLLFRQVILKAYAEKPGLPSPRTLFNSQHLPGDEGPWILYSLASLRLTRLLSLPLTFLFSPCPSYTPPSESSLPLRTLLEACLLASTHWVPGLRWTHCSLKQDKKYFSILNHCVAKIQPVVCRSELPQSLRMGPCTSDQTLLMSSSVKWALKSHLSCKFCQDEMRECMRHT